MFRRNGFRARTLNSRVGWDGAAGLVRQAGYQGGQVSEVVRGLDGRAQRAWFEPVHPSQMGNGLLTIIDDMDGVARLGLVRKPVDAQGRFIDDGSIEGFQSVHKALQELGVDSASLAKLAVPAADGTRFQVIGGLKPMDARIRRVLSLQPGLSVRTFQTMPGERAANLGNDGAKVDLTSYAVDRGIGGIDDVARLLTSWGVPVGGIRTALTPGMGADDIARIDVGGGKLLSVDDVSVDPDNYINYIVHRRPGPLENGVVAREVNFVDPT